MSNNAHEYLSKIKDELNKNFQIGAQGLQACNVSIGHNNQQIEYLLYESQIRKHEMEILKQNAHSDTCVRIDMNKLMLLERTIIATTDVNSSTNKVAEKFATTVR